jgi:hypothetical protein
MTNFCQAFAILCESAITIAAMMKGVRDRLTVKAERDAKSGAAQRARL